MNGIQIVLVTGILFIAVFFYVRLHNSVLDILLLLAMMAAGVIFIIFPGITNAIAHKLGVGRGTDLVFYLSFITFWFVILKLYTRIRKLEKQLVEVIREDALKENSDCP